VAPADPGAGTGPSTVWTEELRAWRAALEAGEPLATTAGGEALAALVDLALHGEQASRATAAGESLRLLGLSPSHEPQHQAFDLLVQLGRFAPDENLHLLRDRVPQQFATSLLAEAARLATREPWAAASRVDLGDLPTVTIDDPETSEGDDALSAAPGPGGSHLVWVHIADPGAFLPPDSALRREAGRRAATLYLPDRKITMLPPVLAEGPASLAEGQPRAALTLQARISPEGRILEQRFLVSRIQVDRRLSYEEADRLQEERGPLGDLLHRLQEAAYALEEARREQGALLLNRPEVRVRRLADGRIRLQPVDPYSPSRSLVAELMILVGTCAARLFMREGIPAISRVQDPPTEPCRIPEGPHDAATAYAVLRRLHRAELSRIPRRHAGLGVEPYVQITSPIRRYGDLLLQEQLRGWLLEGRPRYREEELLDRLGEAEEVALGLTGIERASKRYWTLRYLEGHRGAPVEAQVLEEIHPGSYLVELRQTCLRGILEAPPGLSPGTWLTPRLGAVDARRDRLPLRLAETAPLLPPGGSAGAPRSPHHREEKDE